MPTNTLINTLYKEEYPRLLGSLIKIFGTHNFDLAEDILQEAFAKAIETWAGGNVPDNPTAWIIRVAKNKALDSIRKEKTKLKFSADLSFMLESEWSLGYVIDTEFEADKIKDHTLRMIFMCCDNSLKEDSQLILILRTLCGFSVAAISRALLMSSEAVKKRLQRIRAELKGHDFNFPEGDALTEKLKTVNVILYLLFNEGFYSSSTVNPIKSEFCREALYLIQLLLDDPRLANVDTTCLFILMNLQMARLDAREVNGHIIPINRQDRGKWKAGLIQPALNLLSSVETLNSAQSSVFYYEALILREHIISECFEKTDWGQIIQYYDALMRLSKSPGIVISQAVAYGYFGKVDQGLQLLDSIKGSKRLAKSYQLMSSFAHLYALNGDKERAFECLDEAILLGGTSFEHQMTIEQIKYLLD